MSEDAGQRPASSESAAKAGGVPERRKTLGLRIARLLLAPVLATAAAGVHFWLNVPEDEVRVSSRDQGSKQRDKRSHRRRVEQAHRPRSEAQLAALTRRYAKIDFDDEPVLGRWSRPSQNLINKAVVLSRKQAFEGAPEDPRIIVTGVQCRTVRCRFILRSPYRHETRLLGDALRRVQTEGRSLWRSFDVETVQAPTPGSPPGDHYLQVTVSMVADAIEPESLEVPAAGGNEDEGEAESEQDAEASESR